MTSRTRRLVFFSVLIAALTLPAEGLLLKGLRAQSPDSVIQDWATSLSTSDLQVAASQIQSYPFAYRKAIMQRLTPAARSAVWRVHIARYGRTHALDDVTAAAVQAVSAVATPGFFADPSDEDRQTVRTLAEQVAVRIGRDEAENLFFYLGPKDGTFAAFRPMQVTLVNAVRRVFMLEAFSASCDCSTSFGCESGYTCATWTGCSVDSGWPGCGWFWMDTCDGACVLR